MAATAAQGMPPRVRAWIGGLALVALVAVGMALAHVQDVAFTSVTVGVLAVGVGVAQVFHVWEHGRPTNVCLTISELYVGAALVLLPPAEVVLVVLAGSVFGLALRVVSGPLRDVPARRPAILVHVVSLPVVRAAAAAGVVVSLPGLDPLVAATLGIVALVAVDTVSIATVVHLETGLPLRRTLRVHSGVELVVALTAGASGVLLGDAAAASGSGWILLLTTVAVVIAVSEAGTRWSRERRRTAVVLDAARATGAATAQGDVAAALVDRVAAALVAGRVELVPERPDWAGLAAPLGAHGWVGVSDPVIPTQDDFDHRDEELLTALAGVATVALDNRALVERLEDLEAARSTLLAAAAHDLRSPLAVAEGALSALDAEGVGTPAAEGLLAMVRRSTERASRLVHDLIIIEREHLEAGGSDERCASVADVVDDVVRALPVEDAARCVVAVEDDVACARIPQVQLERVVDNLVGNAVKHTPDDGSVTIRVSEDGDQVLLAVDDQGPGVPPAQRARILEPFARAAASTSGFGLGLHIASEFVRRAGGSLRIEDTAEGPGASFQVRLPASRTASVHADGRG